jgi:hypothetical protein
MINDQANGIRAIKEQALLPKVKKSYVIPKVSKKKKAENNGQNFIVDEVLEKWFIERRKEMTGLCCECGRKSFKEDNKNFKWSLAHILKKSIFHSISTHPSNCLELCWLHHQEFDSSYANAQKMNCWSIAKERFEIMKPSITEKHKDLVWFE